MLNHSWDIQLSSHGRGFSLPEILMALLVGLILLGGIFQIASTITQNYRLNKVSLSLQSEGRFVISKITSVLKQRGFQGCMPPVRRSPDLVEPINWETANYITSTALRWPSANWAKSTLRGFSVNTGGNWEPDPADGAVQFGYKVVDMESLQTGAAPTITASLAHTPIPVSGSDVISIRYAGVDSVAIGQDMSDRADPLYIDANVLNLQQGELVMVGDCQVADIIGISNITANGSGFDLEHDITYNAIDTLQAEYTALHGEIRRIYSRTFHVSDSGRTSSDGTPIHSLYTYDLSSITMDPAAIGPDNHNHNELAVGVEMLRVLYGSANSSGGITYEPAPTNSSDSTSDYWQNVISVKVGVLVRSLEPIMNIDENRVYQVLDRTVGSPTSTHTFKHQGGKFLRQSFSTTIDLKNRSM